MNTPNPPFTFGGEVTFQNLTVVALLGRSIGAPRYDTLDTALAAGTLDIAETSDAGAVPDIRVRNVGQRPVLIIDGQELVGAKQNRTVNLSIAVAAGSDATVPVTCVEAGRWRSRSRTFSAAPRTHFAAGRAAKSAQVSASLLREGVARADQGQVWNEIEERRERLQAQSATGAMADIFASRADAIEAFVRALPAADDQVGGVFVLNGRPAGMDLFDHPPTCRALWSTILRGYALDALALDQDEPLASECASPQAVRLRAERFLTRVLEVDRQHFSAPGLGDTWRLIAPDVSGGGVSLDGAVIHLAAFPC